MTDRLAEIEESLEWADRMVGGNCNHHVQALARAVRREREANQKSEARLAAAMMVVKAARIVDYNNPVQDLSLRDALAAFDAQQQLAKETK